MYIAIDINGKFTVTNDIDKARVFKNETSASKVITGLNKKIRELASGWKVVEIERKFEEDSVKYQAKFTNDTPNMSSVKADVLIGASDFEKICDNIANLETLNLQLQSIYDNKQKYCDLVELYERQECDVLHKIETDNFNASGGFKWAKMIKNIRQKRRAVKNILRFIDKTQGSTDISVIVQEINAIKTLKYFPRALPELFEEV
jgi:hypothetical protein